MISGKFRKESAPSLFCSPPLFCEPDGKRLQVSGSLQSSRCTAPAYPPYMPLVLSANVQVRMMTPPVKNGGIQCQRAPHFGSCIPNGPTPLNKPFFNYRALHYSVASSTSPSLPGHPSDLGSPLYFHPEDICEDARMPFLGWFKGKKKARPSCWGGGILRQSQYSYCPSFVFDPNLQASRCPTHKARTLVSQGFPPKLYHTLG